MSNYDDYVEEICREMCKMFDHPEEEVTYEGETITHRYWKRYEMMVRNTLERETFERARRRIDRAKKPQWN